MCNDEILYTLFEIREHDNGSESCAYFTRLNYKMYKLK